MPQIPRPLGVHLVHDAGGRLHVLVEEFLQDKHHKFHGVKSSLISSTWYMAGGLTGCRRGLTAVSAAPASWDAWRAGVPGVEGGKGWEGLTIA